jgi:hypothetical protein
MSEPKELDFFVKELNWDKGVDWYERHFDEGRNASVIGEASTSYSKWPVHGGVPERVASVLPDARLVYLIRHPIERIRSQYLHQRIWGLERRPIDEAVLVDPSYIGFSMYSAQIRQYLEYFDRSKLFVLSSESLRNDRRAALSRLASFLQIEDSWPETVISEEFHSTADKRVLRGLFSFAHSFPGYDTIARCVPDVIKRKTTAIRTRGIDPSRFALSDEVRLQLVEELHDDLAQLSLYVDGQFECWGLL